MKKLFLFIVVLCLLSNCNARKKTLVHYLSTLENIKVLPPTKEESVIIDSLELDKKSFSKNVKRMAKIVLMIIQSKMRILKMV